VGDGVIGDETYMAFQDALDAAALPFGAGLVDRTEPGWDVATRPDGLMVRLEPRPGATAAQRDAARALVLGLDLAAARGRFTPEEVLAAVAALKPDEREALYQRMLADWLLGSNGGRAEGKKLKKVKK
jgi:hypothetical protein